MIGDHYRLGWTVDTPITQEFKPGTLDPDQAIPPPDLDFLNEGEL
jgi:hypothetical protein